MARGKIKWFDSAKGYGYITQDNGDADVFVHFSAIVSGGERALDDGTPVEYDVSKGPKGLQAANVKALGPS